MTLRSFLSGTINSLRHANSIIAKPIEPVITSAALAGADPTETTIAFTPSAIGTTATSFTAISTPSSIVANANASPITYASGALAAATAYTFKVSGVNANGTGVGSASSGTVTTLTTYTLQQTFTTSGTFTVPAGATKMAVFALGGGSGGGLGNANSSTSGMYGTYTDFGSGGNGGTSSAIAGFKEISVTPAETFTVTIGAGGASNSAGGTTSFGNLLSVTGNTVTGNAANLTSTAAGGGAAGGGGGHHHLGPDYYSNDSYGAAGGDSNTNITLTQNLTGAGAVVYTGSNGGAGGAGRASSSSGYCHQVSAG